MHSYGWRWHLRALRSRLPPGRYGSSGNLIGSNYKTPYAIHVTGGVQHAFNDHWLMSADYVHEQGNHGYRAYPYASDDGTGNGDIFTPLIPTSDPTYNADQAAVVPNVNVFQSDNRSSYNALMLHAQGNMRRFNLVANYTLSKAQTWGCLLGELFDYVNGVCDPLQCLSSRRLRPVRRRRSPPLCARRHGAHSWRFRIEHRHPV